MKNKLFMKKRLAQSMLAYVLIFAIAVAVFLIMAYYIRNGLMGRVKQTGDTMGAGEQFIP